MATGIHHISAGLQTASKPYLARPGTVFLTRRRALDRTADAAPSLVGSKASFLLAGLVSSDTSDTSWITSCT